ncbi:FCD domain-containing protein [Spirillospora sp. NPDC048819]|uniref:FCD domain-containing protein n=1 Tax=Spirillospora sp. NPDC048819 TaxID=3155268 RepID=UPI0033E804F3
MRRSAGTTIADATYARVKKDILNGHLEPGAKMGFAFLGARYDVSIGVLREVLPRLVEQGLATAEPQLGYRVVSLSESDLVALTAAREEIEALVVAQATRVGGLSWEAAIVAAHHELARTPQFTSDDDLREEWLQAHEKFHNVLLDGCGNRHLVDVAVRLRTISEVYRCWSRDATVRTRRDVAGEHRAIADAAIARDADLCAELIRSHIKLTTELLLEHSATSRADDDSAVDVRSA